VFVNILEAYKSIESRLKAEAFKLRVMQLFRAWEDWAIYPKDYLIRLQNNFLGLSTQVSNVTSVFMLIKIYY
jgi:U2-associated protein SR140